MVLYHEKSIRKDGRSENFDAVEPGQSNRWLARAFDVLVAVAGLTFFAPVLLVIAIALRLDSRGPVFVREVQRGQNDEEIYALRFRLVSTGPNGDRSSPGLTWIGAVLRGSGIDELPQLFNVLRGEMSIARARPRAYGQERPTAAVSKESANCVAALLTRLFSGESYRER